MREARNLMMTLGRIISKLNPSNLTLYKLAQITYQLYYNQTAFVAYRQNRSKPVVRVRE